MPKRNGSFWMVEASTAGAAVSAFLSDKPVSSAERTGFQDAFGLPTGVGSAEVADPDVLGPDTQLLLKGESRTQPLNGAPAHGVQGRRTRRGRPGTDRHSDHRGTRT